MSDPYIINLPGAVFARSLDRFRLDLIALISRGDQVFPMADVFNYIRFKESNRRLERKLKRRGEFVPQGEGLYRNKGRLIDEVMREIGPNLERLQLYIPRQLDMKMATENGEITMTVESRVIATFYEPPAPGFGQRFLLRAIKVDLSHWIYSFEQDGQSGNRVDISVNLEIAGQAVAGLFSSFNELKRPVLLTQAFDGTQFPCCLCRGFRSNSPNVPPGPRELRLHAKVIWTPPRTVEDQVDALNEVFAAGDLRVVLASIEFIDLPEFYDVDAGPCTSYQTTAEQRKLFTTVRSGVANGEVAAYWVRSLGLPRIGCAAHPEGLPSLICTQYGSLYVLAHELGHVLGLHHVTNADNLMYDTDPANNPPPDLSKSQFRIMRNSRWTYAVPENG